MTEVLHWLCTSERPVEGGGCHSAGHRTAAAGLRRKLYDLIFLARWVSLSDESFYTALKWMVLAFGHQFSSSLELCFLFHFRWSRFILNLPQICNSVFICRMPGSLGSDAGSTKGLFWIPRWLQRKGWLRQIPSGHICCVVYTRSVC